jgi:2-haloacid dehalogenase
VPVLRTGIKALTFDVFSALYDWETPVRAALQPFLGQRAASEQAEFIRTWRTKQLTYSLYSTLLGGPHVKFAELTRRALRYCTEHFHITLSAAEEKQLVDLWSQVDLFPDCPAPLRTVKKRYPLALLSNGDKQQLASLARRSATKFDRIISAEHAQAYKPHPRVYRTALRLLRLPARAVLHVAGSPFDSVGAKGVGMKVVWINRGGGPHDEWPLRPDAEIRQLGELVPMLE